MEWIHVAVRRRVERIQSAELRWRVVKRHLQALAFGATILEPELDVFALEPGELLSVGRMEAIRTENSAIFYI